MGRKKRRKKRKRERRGGEEREEEIEAEEEEKLLRKRRRRQLKLKGVPGGPHVEARRLGFLSVSPDTSASCHLSFLKLFFLSSCWGAGRTYQEDVPETSRG